MLRVKKSMSHKNLNMKTKKKATQLMMLGTKCYWRCFQRFLLEIQNGGSFNMNTFQILRLYRIWLPCKGKELPYDVP